MPFPWNNYLCCQTMFARVSLTPFNILKLWVLLVLGFWVCVVMRCSFWNTLQSLFNRITKNERILIHRERVPLKVSHSMLIVNVKRQNRFQIDLRHKHWIDLPSSSCLALWVCKISSFKRTCMSCIFSVFTSHFCSFVVAYYPQRPIESWCLPMYLTRHWYRS